MYIKLYISTLTSYILLFLTYISTRTMSSWSNTNTKLLHKTVSKFKQSQQSNHVNSYFAKYWSDARYSVLTCKHTSSSLLVLDLAVSSSFLTDPLSFSVLCFSSCNTLSSSLAVRTSSAPSISSVPVPDLSSALRFSEIEVSRMHAKSLE